MSGPKVLSCSEFSRALNTIFSLQHGVNCMMERFATYAFRDDALGISVDTDGVIARFKKMVDRLCGDFRPARRGTAKEKRVVEGRIEDLEQLTARLSEAEAGLKKELADCKAYSRYRERLDGLNRAFTEYRDSTCEFISDEAGGESGQAALTAIREINPEIRPVVFSSGFSGRREKLESEAEQVALAARRSVDNERLRLVDGILVKPFVAEEQIAGEDSLLGTAGDRAAERERLLLDLQRLIQDVDNQAVRESYNKRLNALVRSRTFTDSWYYRELLDEVRESEEQRSGRKTLAGMLQTIEEHSFQPEVRAQAGDVRRYFVGLMEQKRIDEADLEEAGEGLDDLLARDEKALAEADLKRRQGVYLKEALLDGLRSLGYRVIPAAGIADFESAGLEEMNDFLLDIPDQENWLNLRFEEDGDFLYNFLIPENREDLDALTARIRVEEMQKACGDFHQALEDLEREGVSCTISRDIPISEQALIRIPPRLRERANQAERARTQEAGEKYMNSPEE